MKSRPTFSVIVPVYNKEPHISRSISSILNQNYKSFELIIVNDSSTDNSLLEINKFIDQRIVLLNRESPGPGGYAARNYGIENAKGEWIALLDADDEWTSDHLLNLHKKINEYPNESVFTSAWLINEKSKMYLDNFTRKYEKFEGVLTFQDYFKSAIENCTPTCSSTICFKNIKHNTTELFPIDPKIKKGGDLYAWAKLICRFKSMVRINTVGAIYQKDSINMVSKTEEGSILIWDFNNFQEISSGLNNSEKKQLNLYFIKKNYDVIIKSSTSPSYSKVYHVFRSFGLSVIKINFLITRIIIERFVRKVKLFATS